MDTSLTQFKSTGTYRQFIDNTLLEDLPDQVVRLLVGQFKKGAVNKAVYIKDVNELHDKFGQRDKSLERAGCFSTLIAEQMLAISPIYVLNLRAFTDADKLQRISIAANASAEDSKVTDIAFTQVYDTTNFWNVEPLNLLNKLGTAPASLLNLSTVTNKNVTVFVMPTSSTSYDYTVQKVQERYPTMYVPTLKCTDKVKDYLVDVYFFANDFTKYESLAGSAKYGKYFTDNGIRRIVDGEPGAAALAKVTESGYIGKVTGSLNTNLLDINGNKLSLEAAINAVIDTTGVVCKINPESIDEYYNSNDEDGARFMRSIDLLGVNGIKVEVEGPTIEKTGDTYLGCTTPEVVKNEYEVEFGYADFAATKDQFNEDTFSMLNGVMLPVINGQANLTSFYGPVMPIAVGDIVVGNNGQPCRCTSRYSKAQYLAMPKLNSKELPLQADGTAFPQNVNGVFVYPEGESWAGQPVEYDESTGRPLDKPKSEGGSVMAEVEPDEEHLKILQDNFGKMQNLIEYIFDDEIWSKGTFKAEKFATIDFEGNDIELDVAKAYTVARFTPRCIQSDSFVGYYLKGVALRKEQFVNGTAARQNEILSQLLSGGVYRSLMDPKQIKWRYVVDPFKTYIEGNAKYQFAKICNDSKRAIAFSSLPTKYDMMTSTDPHFKASASGPIEAEYMAAGGNMELPYSKLFSFAGQDYGAPFIGYFGNVRYNNGIDDMVIPATGIISNAYMRKHMEAGKHVWDIVAGSLWPIAGEGVTDIDLFVSQGQGSDLDYLEPAGWDCLQIDNGVITILNDHSAQVSYESAFSYLDNLELLIYVADGIEPYLDAKRFKRNTAAARLDVKTKADAFMEQILSAGGIVSYENVCDTSNNDEETIARGYIVLDTTIVNAQGIRIAVHRTYLELGA